MKIKKTLYNFDLFNIIFVLININKYLKRFCKIKYNIYRLIHI